MSERGLVEAAMHGNTVAFNTLVGQYQRVMVASARRLTRNEADAEDLAQEALVDAYRNLPTLRDHDKFRPWLFGILQHKCLDYLRLRHPAELLPGDELEEFPAPVPAEMPDIADLLDQLPFAFRQVLVMRYLQELDYREIAEVLGINEPTARQRCSRARTQLQALAFARNEGRMRKIMAGLLVFPISDAFTHRVAKEVLTMAQVTAKTKAAAGGTAAGLAWLLGWKGLVTAGVVMAIGAGVTVPVATHWHPFSYSYQTPAGRITFISGKPDASKQQAVSVATAWLQAFLQPNPDWNSFIRLSDLEEPRQNVSYYMHDPDGLRCRQAQSMKLYPLQEIQIQSITSQPYKFDRSKTSVMMKIKLIGKQDWIIAHIGYLKEDQKIFAIGWSHISW